MAICYSQPQGSFTTAPNVLAGGVAASGFSFDVLNGATASVGGTKSVAPVGVVVATPKATVTVKRRVSSGYTLISIVNAGGNTHENFIGADNATRYFQFRSNNGGASVQFIPFDTGGTPYFATSPVPPASTNGYYVVVATAGNGVAQAWSGPIGGSAGSDGSVAVPGLLVPPAGAQLFVGSRDGKNEFFNGKMAMYAMLDGVIDAKTAASYVANPWQIFSPIQSRYKTSVSVTNYQLTAQGGSYTLAGGSAIVSKSKLLTGSSGTYNISGGGATLLRSKKLISSNGTYSLTGGTAILLRSKKLIASGGSYTFTGQPVNITYVGGGATNYSLVAQGGSYSVSGGSATILRSKKLIGSGGSYITVGSNSILLRSRLLVSQGGSYALAGSSAILVKGLVLTAQGGNYTISGNTANLLKSKVLTASGGIYLLMGSTATIYKYTPGANTLVRYINVLTGEILILQPF